MAAGDGPHGMGPAHHGVERVRGRGAGAGRSVSFPVSPLRRPFGSAPVRRGCGRRGRGVAAQLCKACELTVSAILYMLQT